jgi:hypothetical protein
MSIAPALSWQSNKLPKLKIYLIIFLAVSILTTIISYFSFFNTWGFIGIFLSLIIIGSSILSIHINNSKYGLKKV